jgi:hypothetical protein
MAQVPEKSQCPSCRASNYTSSAVCWQCGKPMKPIQTQPIYTPTAASFSNGPTAGGIMSMEIAGRPMIRFPLPETLFVHYERDHDIRQLSP